MAEFGEKYPFSFTDTSTMTIPGMVHGLRTADLAVVLYEQLPGSRRRSMGAGEVIIDELSLDVTITFSQPMSGRGILFG